MRLGWKLIIGGFGGYMLVAAALSAMAVNPVVLFGPALIGIAIVIVGIICLVFKIGGRPKRGQGSGKL